MFLNVEITWEIPGLTLVPPFFALLTLAFVFIVFGACIWCYFQLADSFFMVGNGKRNTVFKWVMSLTLLPILGVFAPAGMLLWNDGFPRIIAVVFALVCLTVFYLI